VLIPAAMKQRDEVSTGSGSDRVCIWRRLQLTHIARSLPLPVLTSPATSSPNAIHLYKKFWNLSRSRSELVVLAGNRTLKMATPGDNELYARMRNGDREAFAELYRRHRRSIYGFALQMTAARELAEDVTQEVFMVLMGDTEGFDEQRGSLKAFLLGVTRNHVLRRLRQERSLVPLETADDLAISVDDGKDLMVQSESIREMRRAILKLPAHYREVLVLCELQELSYAETAAVLDCAIGTVRSRLHRARQLLTEKLNATQDARAPVKKIESARCFA